jgi:phosphoribosylanthranilate isomerase
MTWVKICGMTNLEDALVAVEAGADAVGFVFYERSPRCVTVETARKIVERLPESVEKVGVFVGTAPEAVKGVVRGAALTAAQIYSDAENSLNDEYLEKLSGRVIPAISMSSSRGDEIRGFRVSNGMRSRVIAALVDSGNSERPGGTGIKYDWEQLPSFASRMGVNVIVAGGLSPQNVGEAIEKMKPWGVDVVSGVEASPGKKDPEKVRAFVKAVREMDRRVG